MAAIAYVVADLEEPLPRNVPERADSVARRGPETDDAFDPSPRRPLHLRPVDRRQPRPRSVRRRRCAPVQDAVRASSQKLAECGAVGRQPARRRPRAASARQRGERDRIVARVQGARCATTACVVPMATTNLFSHPVFKDGAFTANDPSVRAFALRKTMDAIDLGVELGATIYVFWGGREGTEADACRDPRTAHRAHARRARLPVRVRARPRATSSRFALEAKPNEPRGDIYFPTTGHMLHFISTLAHPDDGRRQPRGRARDHVRPVVRARAWRRRWRRGKLFHIDLNAQKIGRYDQDLRFGSRGPEAARSCSCACSRARRAARAYDGPRHFDAHAYRTEDDGRRVGLRARLHAHVQDPRRARAGLRRRSRGAGAAGRDATAARGARRRCCAATRATKARSCARCRSIPTRSRRAAWATSGSTS